MKNFMMLLMVLVISAVFSACGALGGVFDDPCSGYGNCVCLSLKGDDFPKNVRNYAGACNLGYDLTEALASEEDKQKAIDEGERLFNTNQNSLSELEMNCCVEAINRNVTGSSCLPDVLQVVDPTEEEEEEVVEEEEEKPEVEEEIPGLQILVKTDCSSCQFEPLLIRYRPCGTAGTISGFAPGCEECPESDSCHWGAPNPDWGVIGDHSDDPHYESGGDVVWRKPSDGRYMVAVYWMGNENPVWSTSVELEIKFDGHSCGLWRQEIAQKQTLWRIAELFLEEGDMGCGRVHSYMGEQLTPLFTPWAELNPANEDSPQSPWCDKVNDEECVHSLCTPPCEDDSDCHDDDPCTEDICLGDGLCENEPVICDDGVECTEEYCNPSTGLCKYNPRHDWCEQNVEGTDWCEFGNVVLEDNGCF